jgi:enoyl-CoA hydratase/carnithine racemase
MKLTQILNEIEKGVATVTLDRPDKMNAFTPTMRKELIEVFGAADLDDSVRVVVVTGAGKAFCAGADLSSGTAAFDRGVQDGHKVRIAEHGDGGGRVSLAGGINGTFFIYLYSTADFEKILSYPANHEEKIT